MKTKRMKIGIRPRGAIFDEATDVVRRIEGGKKIKPQRGWLYFSDVGEIGKLFTPRRLEMLRAIRVHRPESVRALATLTARDVKNVAVDLGLLVSLGLVEMEPAARSGRRRAPRVAYEKLTVEVDLAS